MCQSRLLDTFGRVLCPKQKKAGPFLVLMTRSLGLLSDSRESQKIETNTTADVDHEGCALNLTSANKSQISAPAAALPP
ncbi:hypothetical protein EVAR_26859_1 [Eumeta japonica]|uniref:Uncharacterized protein n=1 Tax=Eumeta variegata TaxID=151549 RepID=A0A4C1VWM0_EUMVA|nr:hypothetical protein EVAR_26859_1 [Eumeta japonica]